MSFIFEEIFFGPIIKQPVDLSLIIEFINLLSLLPDKSSKLLAIVNLVNGFSSNAVKSNLLNGNINFSIISSFNLISNILFDCSCFWISIPSILLVDEPSIGLEPKYIEMVFEILGDLQKNEKKTINLVEQNAKKGLQFADIGYVLVSGQTAIAGKGDELLQNPDVGRLFLGG